LTKFSNPEKPYAGGNASSTKSLCLAAIQQIQVFLCERRIKNLLHPSGGLEGPSDRGRDANDRNEPPVDRYDLAIDQISN
jgi:hypothetical protein